MHAFEVPGLGFSLPAGEAIVRGRFLTVNSASAAVYASAGGATIGVSMDDAPSGAAATLADGIVMVEAGAAITAGSMIEVGSSGKAITKNTGIGVGVAITGAGAAGRPVAVKMISVSAANGVDGVDGAMTQTILYTAANLAAGADLNDTVIAAIPTGYDAVVTDALVISGGAPAGIDAGNTSVFVLEVGSTQFAGVTFDATKAFPSAGVAEPLTLIPAAVDLAAGDVILLTVTNGATADLPVFTVQIMLTLTPAA